MKHDEPPGKVRLDKWLWAARFFKTRGLAAEAIDGGKVQIGGDRVKRSRQVQVGDEVRVRLGPYEHTVVVSAVSEHRGPASEAARLYEETAASRAAREKLAFQLRAARSALVSDDERPSKRDRRRLLRFKRKD
jgi:ribosome-associated heat shock protein Hsp15